jgi:hypothetical protein
VKIHLLYHLYNQTNACRIGFPCERLGMLHRDQILSNKKAWRQVR